MPKFLHHIFKQKKIIFSLVLFSVLAGVTVPKATSADAADFLCRNTPGCQTAIGQLGYSIDGKPPVTIRSQIGDAISNNVGDLLDTLVKVSLTIPPLVSGFFAFLAGTLLRIVLEVSTNGVSYTSMDPALNPAISVGWAIVRNLGNMVIVLALIVIALATILRFQAYDAKKLLPELIIAALLINFSLVICGVVIDASNITMKWALLGGQTQGTTAGAIFSDAELKNGEALIDSGFSTNSSTADYAIRAGALVFFFTTRTILATLYAILFLFRIMALWILVILSPLAFACYVLPITKQKVFDPWVKNFTGWCTVGIAGALFLYLGDAINAKMGTLAATSSSWEQLINGPGKALTGLFQFFIPGAFLCIGFMFAIQISLVGSSGAIAAGKWVKGKAVGAVKGGAAATARFAANNRLTRNTGINYMADKLSGGGYLTTKLGERLGFVRPGTANKNYQDRMAAKMKPYTELTEAEKDSKVLAYRAVNAKSSAERATYVNELQKRKKLHLIDPSRRKAAMGDAEKHGIDTSKFADVDYRYAEFDDKIIKRIQETNPTLTPVQVKAVARQEQLETNLPGMSGEQRRNIDENDLTPELITSRIFTANMVRNFKTADRKRINKIRNNTVLAELDRQIAAAGNNKAESNRLRNIRKEINNLPGAGSKKTPSTPPTTPPTTPSTPPTTKTPPPPYTPPPLGNNTGPSDAIKIQRAYETLGLKPGASDDEIDKAFRKLARNTNPDRNGGDSDKFNEINNAYGLLTKKTP